MKLSLEKLSVECPDYRSVISLNLDCKRLSKIPEIGKCRHLQYISLRFNELLSVQELSNCPKLWIVDLLQNHLSSISGLQDFQVLSSLNLSCNDLTLKSLEPLQSTYLINLELSSPKFSRSEIISVLPHLWILNDVYITQQERQSLPIPNPPLRKIILSQGPSADFTRRFQSALTETGKFEYLIYELDRVCDLEWQVRSNTSKKIKNLKFPKFQLCRWQDIKPASRLVLSCVFYLFLEGFYPTNLVKEIVAIVITESYPDNTPLVEAMELCELPPHYILSFIILLKSNADNNVLWKKIDTEYLVRNFADIQKRWSEAKGLGIVGLTAENLVDRIRLLENRQHLALFVLTVLIKFELLNQFLGQRQGKGLGTSAPFLEGLLEYARIDEETLISNMSESKDEIVPAGRSEISTSILKYSRSLQNLQTTESNSSRYGSFLVKTKAGSRGRQEDAFVMNKFEELSQLKRDSMILRQHTAEMFTETRGKNKKLLPPIENPNAISKGQCMSEQLFRKDSFQGRESLGFKPSEVYSFDNSDKPEFLLAPSTLFKRKSNWKSLAEPPTIYSLTQSQSNLKVTSSHKILPLASNMSSMCVQSYYEDLLKVSITPSNDILNPVHFKIEFPVEGTFLTRFEQEPDRLRVRGSEEDSASVGSEIKFKSMGREMGNNKKWYPVAQKTRFVVDEHFVQNLKPCNFYEEHKELLPTIPEKIYKKPTLMLQGKQPEFTSVNKEIVKDANHLIRVISRENTPWVQYHLKPKNKIKQDAFCANYGELLVFFI